MSSRPRFIIGIVGASMAGVLLLVGLAILVGQLSTWLDTGRWVPYASIDLIMAPGVKRHVPQALVTWLLRPASLYGLHETVTWALHAIPAAFSFITLGAVLLWRSIKW
jgi:hypothetical protein